jgi:hypothetical protein
LEQKKNISFSSAFVNFLANMSYTPTLGSKRAYTISSTWDPKLSNNKVNHIFHGWIIGTLSKETLSFYIGLDTTHSI